VVLVEASGDGGGARVSVAQHNARAAAAPKLGTGAARCEHPVFMARSCLRRKARTGRSHGRVRVATVVVTDPVTCEEDDDAADMWGRAVSVTKRKRRERPGQLLGRCGERAGRVGKKTSRTGRTRPIWARIGEREKKIKFPFLFS